MIKRRKPLARSTKPIARTPLKPSLKKIRPIGKVGKRKQKKRDDVKAMYFATHGWTNLGEAGKNTARCQLCGEPMRMMGSQAHHKKPRGEGGSDVHTNFVILHAECHMTTVHGNEMGRPVMSEVSIWVFDRVEKHEANAVNGLIIFKGMAL